MPEGNLTGFFGKLPSAGDFVTRGLPAELRRMVDRWLTVRFGAEQPPGSGLVALLPFGGGAAALLVMDSADRLGRCYPIAAICHIPAIPSAAATDGWAAAARPHLDAARVATLSSDALAAALAEIPPPEMADVPPALPLDWPLGQPPPQAGKAPPSRALGAEH